jgi:hypothetical protein
MATWRALIPPLLEWMTPLLQFAALHPVFPHGGPASAGASPAQSPAAGATKSPRPSPSR